MDTIIDAGKSIRNRGMLPGFISLILSNLLKNICFSFLFFEVRVRYKAVAKGVNRPNTISVGNMGSPLSASPK